MRMGGNTVQIEVVTFDGYRADERPSAVILDGRRLDVLEVERSWVESGTESTSEVFRGVVVRCRGGERFRLVFSERQGWKAEMLQSPKAIPQL